MGKRNIDKYKFQDLFNMEDVQKLTDSISDALALGIVIVAPDGKEITRPSNFCKFCLNVVRQSDIGLRNCRHSDAVLGQKSDKPNMSRCLSAGLMDAGVSIIIDGKHLASWMLGQVIIEGEELSEEEMRERARSLDLDEEVFLREIKAVPKMSRVQFERVVKMIHVLGQQMSELGLKNYLQKEELRNKESLERQLRKEVENLSYDNKYDHLTGVYTRGYYESCVSKLVAEGRYPIAFVIGDMDNLKLANDVFGHEYGDKLLRQLSDILLKEAKDDYVIGRCGGDEFCIAIPNATENEVEEYRKRVDIACSEVLDCIIPPTVSTGNAVMYSENEDKDMVVKAAETLMYNYKTAKKAKRNIHRDIMNILFRRGYVFPAQIQESLKRIEQFADYINLDKHSKEILQIATQIQDVGLIAVPESIIRKTTALTVEDRMEMVKHPEVGFRLARLYDESFVAADTVLQSHECWEGNGYPNRLKGNEILYTARILYLVSTYSGYFFKKQLIGKEVDVKTARDRIVAQSGKQFDPELVKKFMKYLEEYEPIEE